MLIALIEFGEQVKMADPVAVKFIVNRCFQLIVISRERIPVAVPECFHRTDQLFLRIIHRYQMPVF